MYKGEIQHKIGESHKRRRQVAVFSYLYDKIMLIRFYFNGISFLIVIPWLGIFNFITRYFCSNKYLNTLGLGRLFVFNCIAYLMQIKNLGENLLR